MHCLHYSQRKLVQSHLSKNGAYLMEQMLARYERDRLKGKSGTSWRAMVRWELGRYRREKA